MPSTRSFFHKNNRSQASLLATQDSTAGHSHQASPTDSPTRLQSSAVSPDLREEGQEYSLGQPSVYRPDEGKYYYPVRSQSQRSSYHQPTITLLGPPGPLVIEENPDAYYTQQTSAQTIPKEDPKRRRFFKLGSSSSAKEPSNHSPPANRRSISVRKKNPELPGDAGVHLSSQQRRPTKAPSVALPQATIDQETAEEHLPGALPRQTQESPIGPPLPEKDPLRSPKNYLAAQQEQPYNKPPLQGVNTNLPQRQPYERQGSAASSLWESSARSLQHPRAPSDNVQNSPYQASPSSANSNQTPQSYQASPSSATSTSSHPLQPKGTQEVVQQYRHEFQRERPRSQQSSHEPPSPIHPAHREPYRELRGSNRSSLNAYATSTMGPPPSSQQQSRGRHSDEMEQRNQPGALPRENSGYQPYQQAPQGQGQPNNGQSQYGPQLAVNQQTQVYRGTPQASPLPAQTMNESGRNTPPPSRSRDDLSSMDVAQLLARHDELRKLIIALFSIN